MRRFLAILLLTLTPLGSCRPRQEDAGLSLAAKDYKPLQGEVAYLFVRSADKVRMTICLASEWRDGDCSKRPSLLSYVVLRKLLVEEVKTAARDSALKYQSHSRSYRRFKKIEERLKEKYRIRMAFHLSERDYYAARRQQTRTELEQLIRLEQVLDEGVVFVDSTASADRFSQSPLAEKLRTIFFREKFNFADSAGLKWRFFGNDVVFYGAERRCQRYFPGYRLPTSVEAAQAVTLGLARSSLRFAVKQHYPSYTGVRTFWAADLPQDENVRRQFEQVSDLQQRAWAQNLQDDSVKGQLLMMNFRSALFCVRED